jgi:N-acetylneuraminic acid mutarotase
MPNPRNHLGGIETGGKIYAIGGEHGIDEFTGNDAQVDAFDVITGAWTTVASLPLPISHVHNATFVSGGKVMTVGGTTQGGGAISDVLQYDPAGNSWKKIGDIPVALSAVTADLMSGFIIFTGGKSEGEPVATTWINV